MKELEERLRNPYFIFVFRDPVAVSVRNQVSADLDSFHSMNYTLGTYRLFAQYMESTKIPNIALSYEESLIDPRLTVSNLVEFSEFTLRSGPFGRLLNSSRRLRKTTFEDPWPRRRRPKLPSKF
jgi:hypothetical protein